MGKKQIIIVAALVIIVLVGAIALPNFIRARNTPASNACLNNLRQIDGVKQQWMLENHKTTNDIVTWDDISGNQRSSELRTSEMPLIGDRERW